MNEETLFLEVLAQPPEKRAGYLDRVCAGRPELRTAVEALLAAHERAGNILDKPRAALGPTLDSDRGVEIPQAESLSNLTTDFQRVARPGTVIAGRYTLQEKIGEGGMGEVWVARQTEPVKRKVALKLIKTGMDTRAVLQRFEQERQALALMDHPNIARVLDGGMTPTGQPFFVMELVNGLPLTNFCDELKLSLKERLELFVPICQAVQHAHHKGIVHRDLKPANILVTMIDGKPVPKVIDFGVAKATSGKLTEETMSTGFGAVVGTLEYMSPEQAGFSGEDIDTRADIYSLGVVLYELLTGLRPIDGKRLKQAALNEMIRIIREEEPSKPSTRLSTDASLPSLAAARQIEPRKLTALLRGELDWVVMKCLEKQRERRYETANALARDIQRYLADEAVEARPPSAGYRLQKFIRRNPLQLTLAGLVAVLVLGSVSVVWWQQDQAMASREAGLRQQLAEEQRALGDAARLARNAEAVASLLGHAQDALQDGDAAKAAVVLETARKRSAEGGAEKDAERLLRLEADLALVRDLDELDNLRWTSSEAGRPEGFATRTQEVLRRFGTDPDVVSLDEATERVSSSVVRERIVEALDRLLRHKKQANVRDLLRRLDADSYRDAVRDAVLGGDEAKLRELVDRQEALEQAPGFAYLLGESPEIASERRRQLLQSALQRRPGSLGLLMLLGSNSRATKGSTEDRSRWYQAAVAAVPSNNVANVLLASTLMEKGEIDEAIAYYHKAIELDSKFDAPHIGLGVALRRKKDPDGAIACFRKAIELDPNNSVSYSNLGATLAQKQDLDGAIASCRKAIELDPANSAAHYNLGLTLSDNGRLEEAITSFHKAIELDPNNAEAHNHLGTALGRNGQMDEAIASYRKAIELDPKYAEAHNNLGAVLGNRDAALGRNGQIAEAIACFRKAIELDPEYVQAYLNLGSALEKKRDLGGAVTSFRKAIELDPKNVDTYIKLGIVLTDMGEMNEAIALLQQAIDLNPGFPNAHCELGLALSTNGQFDEAIDSFKKAIELDPRFASAHYNLGNSLRAKGQLDEAVASYRKAIEFNPNFAEAYCNIGLAMEIQGRFADSLTAYKQGHELGKKQAGWSYPSAMWVQRAEVNAVLEAELGTFLKGEKKPRDAAECVSLAELCHAKKLDASAARFMADAFAADPQLADDLKAGHRYNAACVAALAAAGQSNDAGMLNDQEKVRLRQQALGWLRADLVLLTQQLETANRIDPAKVRQMLLHWQKDSDLACIRETDALAKLPAEEQQALVQLWADVAILLTQVENIGKQQDE